MVQVFEDQAQIGAPSGSKSQPGGLRRRGPRRSCGGAVQGRFGVVSDELCQLGHCCRKGANGPQVPSSIARQGCDACLPCQLLAVRLRLPTARLGHSHDHRQIDWECLADFLTPNPSRPAGQRHCAGAPEKAGGQHELQVSSEACKLTILKTAFCYASDQPRG